MCALHSADTVSMLNLPTAILRVPTAGYTAGKSITAKGRKGDTSMYSVRVFLKALTT